MTKSITEHRSTRTGSARCFERAFARTARIGLLIVLLGAGAATLVLMYQDSSEKQVVTLRPMSGEVRIPLAELRQNRAAFFQYYPSDRRSRPVALLAWKSSGAASAALDACRNCYKFLEGYHQSGGSLKCVYCGEEFNLSEAPPPSKLDCYPIPLRSSIRSNQLFVSTHVLEDSLSYFNAAADDGAKTFNISEGESK